MLAKGMPDRDLLVEQKAQAHVTLGRAALGARTAAEGRSGG
jgi:hypothetical protein